MSEFSPRRRHRHEEHENHERWLVSYADFITLLFAFFVVLYSVSAVNEGKFRTVSNSLKAAINPVSITPSGGTIVPGTPAAPISLSDRPVLRPPVPAISKIRDRLQSHLSAAEFSVLSFFEHNDGGLTIRIPTEILFAGGNAIPQPSALPMLQAIGDALTELRREARIHGHTDNVPIQTPLFPTNWELSGARAINTLRILTDLYGVSPDLLSAVAHGDTHPVIDNLTPDHRRQNRRIDIIIPPPAVSPSDETLNPEPSIPTTF